MELKEIIKIIIKARIIFFIVFLVTIFSAMGWLLFQPKKYQTSLAIDITRESVDQTADYRYDQYYRFLADEKFADTIVQWTKDPQIVKDIFDKAGVQTETKNLKYFSGLIRGEKLSSNFVQIKFSVREKDNAEKIAKAINEIFSNKTSKINESAKSNNWFKLNFGRAIIVEYHPCFALVLLLSAIGGLILSVFAVMLNYYWKEEADK